nr:MAG TPA_asm: hypothetical protein [Caudoviricetes sp.]
MLCYLCFHNTFLYFQHLKYFSCLVPPRFILQCYFILFNRNHIFIYLSYTLQFCKISILK